MEPADRVPQVGTENDSWAIISSRGSSASVRSGVTRFILQGGKPCSKGGNSLMTSYVMTS